MFLPEPMARVLACGPRRRVKGKPEAKTIRTQAALAPDHSIHLREESFVTPLAFML